MVGRVRRKIEQPCTYGFDRFLDTGELVDRNIVHDTTSPPLSVGARHCFT